MMEERNGCLCFDGYTLVKESLDCVPMDGKAVVNTISPNSYGISQKDAEMDQALKGADYLDLLRHRHQALLPRPGLLQAEAHRL